MPNLHNWDAPYQLFTDFPSVSSHLSGRYEHDVGLKSRCTLITALSLPLGVFCWEAMGNANECGAIQINDQLANLPESYQRACIQTAGKWSLLTAH